jgi:hypothetical protein
MNVSRIMRTFLVLLTATSLVECSGGGASHSIPASGITSGHRVHAMGLGTISGCGEYPDGSVAVWDQRAREIYFYEGPVTSSSTPTATITIPGSSTFPRGGMTFDPSGNLWITEYSTDTPGVYEFSAPLTTSESPSITISGSNTGLEGPTGISYNSATGNIFVTDLSANTIDVWSASASGNVAPSAAIVGASTDLDQPQGIKTDANYIYVSNESADGIDIFNLTDSGNVSPTNTISISAEIDWFDFDVARNLYVPQGSNTDVYIPLGGYTTSHAQNTSFSLIPIAVDDAGYIYGTAGTSLYVIDPVNWAGTSVTLSATVSLGGSALPESIALYSPGKFNGTEPQ